MEDKEILHHRERRVHEKTKKKLCGLYALRGEYSLHYFRM